MAENIFGVSNIFARTKFYEKNDFAKKKPKIKDFLLIHGDDKTLFMAGRSESFIVKQLGKKITPTKRFPKTIGQGNHWNISRTCRQKHSA